MNKVSIKKTTGRVSKSEKSTKTEKQEFSKVGEIYVTHDYSKFKDLLGNRCVNPRNLLTIENSIIENGYILNPIKVNSKFEIIDGQHRFNVLKKMNMPIHFYIDENAQLKDVQTHNRMSPWKKFDYLKSFVDLGGEEYIKFDNFYKEYKDLGLNNCISIAKLTNPSTRGESMKSLKNNNKIRVRRADFIDGNFKFTDYDVSVNLAKKIKSLSSKIKKYNDTSFITAFIKCSENPKFDFKRFYEQLDIKPVEYPNAKKRVGDWIKEIQTIYNYNRKPSQRVMLERI
jgi:hypothetical protein